MGSVVTPIILVYATLNVQETGLEGDTKTTILNGMGGQPIICNIYFHLEWKSIEHIMRTIYLGINRKKFFAFFSFRGYGNKSII